MITEKMLELILIRDLIRDFQIRPEDNRKCFGGGVFVNGIKIWDRQKELLREFINPYVVDEA